MKGKVLYYLSFGFQFLVELTFITLLSNKLSSDDFFILNQVNYALPFLIILINFGTSYSILYLSSYNISNRIKDQANIITISVGIILICTTILVFFINNYYNYFIIGSFVGIFYAIKQNYNSFYLSASNHKRAAVSRIAQKTIVLLLTLLYFLLFQTTIIDFILLYIIFEIISFILVLKINPLPKNLNLDKAKSILKFSRFAFFSNLYGVTFAALPSILITENEYTKITITAFLLGLTFLRYISSILAPAFQIISPTITRRKSDIKFIKNYIKKYDLVLLFFGVIVWLIVYFFGEKLLKIFYSDYDVYFYFKIISIAIPLIFVSALQSSLISALGLVKKKNKTELFLLIFFGVTMYLIIKKLDLIYLSYLYVFYYLSKIIVNKVFIILPYINTKKIR